MNNALVSTVLAVGFAMGVVFVIGSLVEWVLLCIG